MHNVNPLLDPENVPIMPARDQLSRRGDRGDMNLFDLLAPLEHEKSEDVGEEPPWIAEFLGQYRLVFGNSGRVAPALRNEADTGRVEKSQPDSKYSLPENRTFGKFEPIASEQRGESSSAAQESATHEVALAGNWTWIHSAVAIALVALVAALLVIFLQSHRRKFEGNFLSAVPIVQSVQSQVTNSKSATPMSSSELPETSISSEDVGSGVPLRKVLPAYPRAALDRRLEGNVALEAEITRDGKVSGVTVLSGDPILARAATDAVRQWVYASSTSDDPREQRVTIQFKAP